MFEAITVCNKDTFKESSDRIKYTIAHTDTADH